ncbi:hypothetical protein BDF20DRAFT_843344 [Mycotypha africana]|uniref:uncharacterized protein n=1 Tax=Mycotypha africana TaxID=64632 RepID=UPI002301AC63|nr:uncharacterized protein BDF20DRAFT_843344 [Mycotypha africana]KAI8991209.1 hypothetical protein BDF20DRAFT_843344 [Mycotypha africana]
MMRDQLIMEQHPEYANMLAHLDEAKADRLHIMEAWRTNERQNAQRQFIAQSQQAWDSFHVSCYERPPIFCTLQDYCYCFILLFLLMLYCCAKNPKHHFLFLPFSIEKTKGKKQVHQQQSECYVAPSRKKLDFLPFCFMTIPI